MEYIDDNFNDYPVDFPESNAIIKVFGVGGGGSNVAKEIYRSGLKGIDLTICNTDAQALKTNPIDEKICLGINVTKGLGAGLNPRRGREAALASREDIIRALPERIEMVFVTACLGGGTGTGAAPVVAEIAKSLDKLVVGVVSLPFRDEGKAFMDRAMEGLHDLKQYVDSLLIIDNQKIYEVYADLPTRQAFPKVNEVLVTAVKSIAEIVTTEGEINVDMNDVRMVMGNSGMATMGIGEAEGEDRAVKAVEEALKSPLLSDCDLSTSKGVLVNVTCSDDNFTMAELRQALENVKSFTGSPTNFKRGLVYDPSLGNKVSITIIATGFDVLNLPAGNDTPIVIPGRQEETQVTRDIFKTPQKTSLPHGELLKEDITPQKHRGNSKPVLITDDDNQILELERTPAYERRNDKKRNLGGTNNSFSITGTQEGQAVIPNNRYLYKTQD